MASSAVTQRKPAGGRPAIPLDLAKIEALAARFCSEEEIAIELGVSADTLQRRKQKTEFAKAIQHGRAKGRVRLRSAQYELALAGNPVMQIWLGKQPGPCGLSQIDTSHLKHSGVDDGPIRVAVGPDLSLLTEDEIQQFRCLAAKAIPRARLGSGVGEPEAPQLCGTGVADFGASDEVHSGLAPGCDLRTPPGSNNGSDPESTD